MAFISGTLCLPGQMHIADIIVVYFAYGVPFGVYQVARAGRKVGFSDAARLLFWPLVLAKWVRGYLSGNGAFPQSDLDAGLSDIRRSIESMAFPSGPAADILEFRDLCDRYVALSLMASTTSRPYRATYAAADQALSRSTAVCLSRRNRLRVEFHRDRAGADLQSFICRIPTTSPKYGAIMAKCLRLALLVDDPELALEFSRRQSAVTEDRIFEPLSVPKPAN